MEKVRNWAKMQQKNAKKPPKVEDFLQNRLFFVTKSVGLEVYSEQNPLFWEEGAWQSQVHDSQECMTWQWRVHDSHKNNNNNKKKKLWFWTIFSLAAFNSSKSCSSWILLCRRYNLFLGFDDGFQEVHVFLQCPLLLVPVLHLVRIQRIVFLPKSRAVMQDLWGKSWPTYKPIMLRTFMFRLLLWFSFPSWNKM